MNPSDPPLLPEWAPRVRQSLIRRLYETDTLGIYDDELLDEVGWALLARCETFITAVEAFHGRAKCPACGQIVLHNSGKDEVLHCAACGWEVAWQVYFKTFQHKQLSGAEPVLALFQEFLAQFPASAGIPRKDAADRPPDPRVPLLHAARPLPRRRGQPDRGELPRSGGFPGPPDLRGGQHARHAPGSPGMAERINQAAEKWADDRLRRKPE